MYPDLLIPGEDLSHDLALLIAALSETVPAAEPAEGLITLDELSKRLNVSTRTIRRWRKLGLVGRRSTRDGKRQVCFEESVVHRFLNGNQERVERGGKFSQMTELERENILSGARQLLRACQTTLTEVSRRIARQLGRSVETVRYTIRNFDKEHPEEALFPKLAGPLDAAMKESIYTSYRQGDTVETLAKKI
jgi:DNA-binding transcriptional MerR regulator